METIISRKFLKPRVVMFKNRACIDDPSIAEIKSNNKSLSELKMVQISKSNSSKMETKKILAQEITLTSKAPLKILEMLEMSINNGSIDACLISEVCKYLKNKGKDLDQGHSKEAFNHYFNLIRNISRDLTVDSSSRIKLLEVIELRARDWRVTEDHASYYAKKKISSSNNNGDARVTQQASVNSTASTAINNDVRRVSPESTEAVVSPSLSSGDVIKHSVNPGAKDRLLQITGPDESSINKAKYYIEDTIKRNASPIPCDQSSKSVSHNDSKQAPAPLNQHRQVVTSLSTPVVNKLLSSSEPCTPFVQTISIGNEVMIISCSSSKLAQEARNLIQDHFRRNHPDSVFHSYGSREPSESSDSDIFIYYGESDKSKDVKVDERKSPLNSVNNTNGSSSMDRQRFQKSASQGSLATGNSVLFSLPRESKASSNKKKFVYDRDFLVKCARSELCKIKPNDIKTVTQQIPEIARKTRQFRANSVESGVN